MRRGSTSERPEPRSVRLRLIRDAAHTREVVEAGILSARISVWISTANLKDVHVEAPVGTRARASGRYVSLFEELQRLAASGVEVRILHAGVPSRALRARMAGSREKGGKGGVGRGVEMRCCPRVHQKIVAVDGKLLYLGSANLTGAGLGAKGEGRRNFELGIVTDDDLMLDAAQGGMDDIWRGRHCGTCRLRSQCPLPLDGIERSRAGGRSKGK